MNSPTRRTIACLAVIAGLLFCLCILPTPFGFPIVALLYVAFGWIGFAYRVLPQLSVNGSGVAMALTCLTAISVGGHWFLRWLYAASDARGNGHPATAAAGGLASPLRWRPRWTVCLVATVVLMFVSGICVVGVAHQSTWLATSKEPLVGWSGRESRRRMQSSNNLKQIGLALQEYHISFDTFPEVSFTALGRPLHGWQTAILPYIEQKQLCDQINLSVPWDDARHRKVFTTIVPEYQLPSSDVRFDAHGYALSFFAGNSHVLGGARCLTVANVTDGLRQTILAGEAAGNYRAWGDPVNWRDPALGLNRSPDGFGNPTSKMVQILFADGSVQAVSDKIDPEVLRKLATPNGGERVWEELGP